MRVDRQGVLPSGVERKYLVSTDYGDVVVRIDEAQGSLSPGFLILEPVDEANSADVMTTVPLRAFGAKMLELIEMYGGDMPGGPSLQRMMMQEKASSDLNRIERFARQQADAET